MKYIVLTVFALACLFSCKTTPKNQDIITRDEYLSSLDSASYERSLVACISDTAFVTNSELILLLDTLYQHVKAEKFPDEVRNEEKWMSEYRSKLCSYYDSHSMGVDTISNYAKADSVLNEGVRLMELGNHWSTMEMIATNTAQFTFDRCREYGMLTQLINSCDSEKAKDLIYREWTVYEQMFHKMGTITASMVHLNYWGGSIAGPLRTAAYLQIIQTRRDMCQTMLNILNSRDWDNTGIFLSDAEQLLYTSTQKALYRIVSDNKELFSENEESEIDSGFVTTARDTEKTLQGIKPLVRKWIAIIAQLDEEVTTDSTRHSVERAASFLLMKWASIVTEK